MGRWAQARKRGSAPNAAALPPPPLAAFALTLHDEVVSVFVTDPANGATRWTAQYYQETVGLPWIQSDDVDDFTEDMFLGTDLAFGETAYVQIRWGVGVNTAAGSWSGWSPTKQITRPP